ncbi:DNA replication factor [Pilaira anomala]|nr:DNA replication factor [Pilaira anomala]
MSGMDIDKPLKNKGKEKVFNLAAELDNLPWIEKYRPKTLDDLVSQDNITSTIENFIQAKKLPHLLFYGPPGTGKTSTILASARQLYGDKFKSMILELNASDDRGIDVVREQIKNFASTRNIYTSGFKLIVLDEADAMTNQAQAALRRVIEKYTKNVRFCIICNYVSRILPAIQSRCTRFRFSPLDKELIEDRLKHVIEAEHVNITDDGKEALLRLSKGDMRRALNILQACHASYDRIDETAVYNCTGHPDPKVIDRIARSLMSEEFTTVYTKIEEIKKESGIALQDIITDLHTYTGVIDYPPKSRILLLKNLSQLEYRLSEGANENIQLGALVSTFKQAQENLV